MRETIGFILLAGGGLSVLAGFLLCVWAGMSVEQQMGHMDINTYRGTGLGIKLLVGGFIFGLVGYFVM